MNNDRYVKCTHCGNMQPEESEYIECWQCRKPEIIWVADEKDRVIYFDENGNKVGVDET